MDHTGATTPICNFCPLAQMAPQIGVLFEKPLKHGVLSEGGGGQKMSAFVHAQGIKTVHEGRGRGSKNDEILSTQLLNAPKSKIQIKKIAPDFHLNLF